VSDTLVDSSAWIDFFRGDARAIAHVDPLLRDDRAAVSGPIVAEVASGARTPAVFQQLRTRLGAVTMLEAPADIWALVDLLIALTASHAGHAVLTRDRDFAAIARAVPLDVEIF
jgi:predicted nucleic acid-binding protein